MTPHASSPPPGPAPAPAAAAQRAAWLGILARADAQELARLASPVLADYRFEALRAPEPGLVMVRARIGNTGDRFNLGEATVTRCAVRLHAPDGSATAGVGYVLGRDAQRAQCIAQLDALLQCAALQPMLLATVVAPLRASNAERERAERERTEATRVRFFTLQPEVA
jgi:alpha-D-ribose 1-methylphosphonate 5-triphosphate synthase subunit PhnG